MSTQENAQFLEKSFKSIKENSIKTTKDISEKKTSKKNIKTE